jgi:hypothetical protein
MGDIVGVTLAVSLRTAGMTPEATLTRPSGIEYAHRRAALGGIMAKREPLFEADLGDNGGLVRLWDADDVGRFISNEETFWAGIHGSDQAQPFAELQSRLQQMASGLRHAMEAGDRAGGGGVLSAFFGEPATRIPLSASPVAQGIARIGEAFGAEAARGAVAITLAPRLWNETLRSVTVGQLRGMVEQIFNEQGTNPQSIEAAKRTLNGLHGRASQVFAQIEDRASEQLETSAGRNTELERQRLAALTLFQQQATDTVARLEATHSAYLEQMKLKAPVEYWREKATGHRTAARNLRHYVWGFFVLMIGGYVIAFAALHQQLSAFLLQFQGSTGALLVISAAFALLASLPLWVGRLLIKFYLSEHHLATDAKEREVMTQTYLALTAEGAVDQKDRTLILGALFRSTPDGVVKDNSQPDTSPAAMLSKLLESR